MAATAMPSTDSARATPGRVRRFWDSSIGKHVVMAVTGIMMYDIIRNMWSWDSPMSINSTLMDMIPGVRK